MITTGESLSSSMINPNTDEPIEIQVAWAPPIVTPRASPAQNSPSWHTHTDVLQGGPGNATDQRSRPGLSSESRAIPEPRSLHDTLTKCIPENSDMMRSIRARKPNALLVNETHPEGLSWYMGTMDNHLKKLHDNPPRSGGSVLIIEDIDEQFGQVLLTKFGKEVSPEFLARHMIRLDSQSAVDYATKKLDSLLLVTYRNRWIKLDDPLLLAFALTRPLDRDINGFHVDCDFSSVVQSPSAWGSTHVVTTTSSKKPHFSFDFYGPDPSAGHSAGVQYTDSGIFTVYPGVSGYSRVMKIRKKVKMQKTRTRLSCCQLEPDLYLVLVEATPDLSSGKKPLWDLSNEDSFQRLLSFSFRMDKELPEVVLRSPIVIEQGTSNCMMTTALRLFQHHTPQSVFQPKDVPFFNPREVPDSYGKCHILVWLLVESTWQLAVASLDSRLQRLRRRAANEASDKAFSLLKDFRREVADARMLIAELRERYIQAVGEVESWIVATSSGPEDRQETVKVGVDDFWLQERSKPAPVIFGRAQSMDIKNLPETLEKLEQRINAITQAVNEEMQVVIGSVQIEDAKTMKRQAEWTVVLAVLAAVYLPMTLVSGLFGMNIIEITTTVGAPGKWSVVKAWGVAFGATAGTIVFYAAGRMPVTWVMSKIHKHQEAQARKSKAKALAKERLEDARA